VYSDKFEKIVQPGFTPTLTAQSFLDDNRNYLFAHDSCSTCPPSMRTGTYLFYPLKELTKDMAKGEQSGFAGVLLNEGFVRDDLIARTIERLSTNHAPAIAITISDENQRVLYSNAAAQNGFLLETNFDRPFSNWKAGIGLKNTNLEDLARNSFLHSAGATFLVLVVLLCGIALYHTGH